MFKEFKEFAMRGNVVDMAIGVVVGAAFATIAKSLVDDILMPPIGLVAGHSDFSNKFINLSGHAYNTLAEAKLAGAATINYGIFLNATFDFILVAFAVFMLIRQINRLKRADSAAATAKECLFCFSAIPIRATRCPHCTSALQIKEVAASGL